jgi:predicted molibdopterin-dependent oxidoreductase YjgC
MEAQLGVDTSAGFDYQDVGEIWEEMRELTPQFYGITYDRLEKEGGVHWPCPSLDHPERHIYLKMTFHGTGEILGIRIWQ